MKKLADVMIVVAVISMAVGILSRLVVVPVLGINASAIYQFAAACLLLAIALLLRGK